MGDSPAVCARGLTVRYGPHSALDGLDLEIPPRGTFGLLGRNGAGKTTTIRAIAGLVRPSGGTISVLGRDPRTDPAVRKDLSFLFSEDGLLSLLGPRQNLLVWGMACGMHRTRAKAAAEEALDRAGLEAPRDLPVRDLSSGNRRVVALARAFMLPSAAVVLDEPTASLDPVRASAVRETLRALARDRLVILSTHDLAEAGDLCDVVAIIHRGRVAASGPPRSLGREARAAFLVRVEGGSVALDGRTIEPGPDGSARIETEEKPSELLARLVGQGNRVEEFRSVSRTLSEVFMELAGD